LTTLWFSFGFLLLLVIDKITDLMWDDSAEEEKPVVKLDPPSATSTTTEACSHDVVEASKPFQSSSAQPTKAEILKMGCKTVLAICLHNLPEGAATYIGAVADRSFGITLALAIGLHNIPEGLSVAMPVYYATGSRWKGFLAAFFSGVPNPVGALVCYYCFSQTDHLIFAACFGAVAGLMVRNHLLALCT
jgi:ZIP family zinc transporter